MMTVPDLLVRGLDLPPVDTTEPVAVPAGTTCAITGQSIVEGYPIQTLCSDATAEYLDTFRGQPCGYLGEAASRAFRWQRQTSLAAMIFADGTCYRPLISRTSAAQDPARPCWSDLVRAVWPERRGEECLILLTTEMKKRLWPRARAGVLGSATALYLYDASYSVAESRVVDWPALLECLGLVEEVYTAGFVKDRIRHGLWSYHRMVEEVGIAQSACWERALAGWRARPEFLSALLIAQKQEES